MKEYDRVELIVDRKKYNSQGVKKGDKGTILGCKKMVIGQYILMVKSFKMKKVFGVQLKQTLQFQKKI